MAELCSQAVAELIRLDRQVSAGPDGVRYAGVDPNDGASVVVERLFLAKRAPGRWPKLNHRIRLAAQLEAPGLAPFRGFQGDGDDPYLVIRAPSSTLAERLIEGIEHQRAIAYVVSLAQALDAGHRLNLVHGHLCPSRVPLDADGEIALELFGTRTGDPRPLDAIDRPCLEPDGAGPESDVYSLAALAVALLTGEAHDTTSGELPTSIRDSSSRLDALLTEMLLPDPMARPSMAEVAERLQRSEATEALSRPEPVAKAGAGRLEPDIVLGRYRLEETIGEGAMGKVFRARDIASAEPVALKVIHPHCAEDSAALQRFYREARLLAELDNPHIARFIEVNEDRGAHFLAMELVLGTSVEERLKTSGPLDEAQALAVVRDVATALADVHDIGAVHRDVKPSNILLVPRQDGVDVAKLCDFGIARSNDPGDGELTRVGMAVGTPHYMSPEQCTGDTVGPATDVYALGITLFKMLVGRVPFNATATQAIVAKHLTEPVPDIANLRPDLSEATMHLVYRMLEKDIGLRIADARSLLEAIEQTRGTGPTNIAAHPKVPEEGSNVQRYAFCWQLSSPPEALWPHVSNTERLNRAIGLGAVEYERDLQSDEVATFGHLTVSGMALDWREHAYEWVAPRRLGILREFSAGPFVWMRSSVELVPNSGGTELHHVIDVVPRGVLGRAATAMEVGYRARRNLERVYQRIDRICSLEDDTLRDPFQETGALDQARRARLDEGRRRLLAAGARDDAVELLCRHLAEGADQDVARIRPRALARRFGVEDEAFAEACMRATQHGLLEMLWDVICPRCQIPSNIAESLAALRAHDRCEACDLSFDLDFGRSVEVFFRAHPAIRTSELGVYCIGGPGHTPHVLAQVRLAPGERFEVELGLDPGHYRVAVRTHPMTWPFVVEEGAPLSQWELDIGRSAATTSARQLAKGRQRLVLNNALGREVVARVEKSSGRQHALTAAEMACSSLFRELFPGEILGPGQLIGVGWVTLLLVELADAWQPGRDESEVFGALNGLKERASEVARRDAGSVIKLHGDGVLLAFDDPLGAVRAGMTLVDEADGERLCAAAHGGSAMATTINARLDYFGRVVRELDTLCRAADPGVFAIAESLHSDPGATLLLADRVSDAPVVNAHGVVGLLVRP